MFGSDFFSRSATVVTGVLLLTAIVWAMWMLGPTALQRWFG